MKSKSTTHPNFPMLALAGVVLGSSIPAQAACAFDRQASVNYANTYAINRNTAYAWYPGSDPSGNDCANFVSQCLIAGGLNIEARAAADGKSAYLAGNTGKKTIPNVGNLQNFLFGYATGGGWYKVWEGPNTTVPNGVAAGDAITIGRYVNGGSAVHWSHSLVVASTTRGMDNYLWPGNVSVNCHSSANDAHNYHVPLDMWWGEHPTVHWQIADFFRIDRTGEETTTACQQTTTPPCPQPPCCGQTLRKIMSPTEIE